MTAAGSAYSRPMAAYRSRNLGSNRSADSIVTSVFPSRAASRILASTSASSLAQRSSSVSIAIASWRGWRSSLTRFATWCASSAVIMHPVCYDGVRVKTGGHGARVMRISPFSSWVMICLINAISSLVPGGM